MCGQTRRHGRSSPKSISLKTRHPFLAEGEAKLRVEGKNRCEFSYSLRALPDQIYISLFINDLSNAEDATRIFDDDSCLTPILA